MYDARGQVLRDCYSACRGREGCFYGVAVGAEPGGVARKLARELADEEGKSVDSAQEVRFLVVVKLRNVWDKGRVAMVFSPKLRVCEALMDGCAGGH